MADVPRVLIVDEDPDSRVETRKTILRAKYEVAGEVGLGADAVTYANASPPDLVLLAVEEPVSRPMQTAESLANVLPETPILFYGTATDAEAWRRAVLAGARDYLPKPVQATVLQTAIVRALEFEEKRQMRRAGHLASTPVRGTVILVSGAKGGIGKSVIAVNLALALKLTTSRTVALIDADVHFGDVATMLDLPFSDTTTNLLRKISEVDRWTIGDYLQPAPTGLSVLPSPVDTAQWEAVGPEALKKITETLALNHDFVVVDTAGAMDPFVHAVADVATIVLLITTAEVSSLRDSRAALQRLNTWEVPEDKIKVVLNWGSRAEGVNAADVPEILGRPLFWEFPRDSAVPQGVQVGHPVALGKPKAKAAQNIYSLAGAIAGVGRAGAIATARMNGSTQEENHGSMAIFGKLGLRRRGKQEPAGQPIGGD